MCKAYDRVNWNFLKAVLLSMNFSNTWVNWIMECVTSVQYTLLLNSSPTQAFCPSRDIGQCDPISAYLFLFCANILSITLSEAKSHKKIKGITIGRSGFSFTHLFFFFFLVDDSLFLFQNDKCSPSNLKSTIMW